MYGVVKCKELNWFSQLGLWNSFPAQHIVVLRFCTSGSCHSVRREGGSNEAASQPEQGYTSAPGQRGVNRVLVPNFNLPALTCWLASVPRGTGCTVIADPAISGLRKYLAINANDKVIFLIFKECKGMCRSSMCARTGEQRGHFDVLAPWVVTATNVCKDCWASPLLHCSSGLPFWPSIWKGSFALPNMRRSGSLPKGEPVDENIT